MLSYAEMALRVAALTASRAPVQVPWIPHMVSAMGVQLLTDVDGRVAQDLLGSMRNEAIVTDDSAARLLPRSVLGFDEAAGRALDNTER